MLDTRMPAAAREEIEMLFDKVMEGSGKPGLFECPLQRAEYLHRWAQHLRSKSALESIDIYARDDFAYARGEYWNIQTEPTERGLLCRYTENPTPTRMQLLILAYFRDLKMTIVRSTEEEARSTAQTFKNVRARHRNRKGTSWVKEIHIYVPRNSPCSVVITKTRTLEDSFVELTEEEAEQLDPTPNFPAGI